MSTQTAIRGEYARLSPEPFEAQFLGGPVFRLMLAGPGPEARQIRAALKQARAAKARLVSCRVPQDWTEAAKLLEACGFRKTETLVTFGRHGLPVPECPLPWAVATTGDATACAEIGRTAFTFDRFHADPSIPDSVADAIKEAWVLNAFHGRADTIFVVREHGVAMGFNLCLFKEGTAVIDLIAVAPEAQGRGVGRSLVVAALAHYRGRAQGMRAGTQADNHASIALYKGLGFKELNGQHTFHWTAGL